MRCDIYASFIRILCGGALLLLATQALCEDEQIRIAYFPPVPEFWTQSIDHNTVVYKSPSGEQDKKALTEVRLTYSRDTKGRNAEQICDDYVKQKRCSPKERLGKGFFMTSCKLASVDAVFVGESDNMYTVEITGLYTREAKDLVNKYLNDIVKGKFVFRDRFIGDPDAKD